MVFRGFNWDVTVCSIVFISSSSFPTTGVVPGWLSTPARPVGNKSANGLSPGRKDVSAIVDQDRLSHTSAAVQPAVFVPVHVLIQLTRRHIENIRFFHLNLISLTYSTSSCFSIIKMSLDLRPKLPVDDLRSRLLGWNGISFQIIEWEKKLGRDHNKCHNLKFW